MSGPIVIVLTAALVGIACALAGSFLVLRRMALLGDAISHSVLLGIVAVFWLTGSRSAPLMVIGAGAVGLLTVSLVEAVYRTGRVREDAAIGLVFPALFSIGVIAVSRFPSAVHLDVDHVLYGEIAYAHIDKIELFGYDLGYRSLWLMGIMALVNLVFVALFYKALKLATFGPALAAALGFSPLAIHYGLMALASATTAVALDSVGAVLVVGILVVPAATAYLLTDRLPIMLVLASLCGSASAVGGYWLARRLDGSIAGAMATFAGVLFLGAFLIAPRHGLVARAIRLRQLRRRFALDLLLSHLEGNHGTSNLSTLQRRFLWSPSASSRIVGAATSAGLIEAGGDGRLRLTDRGRVAAREVPVPEAQEGRIQGSTGGMAADLSTR